MLKQWMEGVESCFLIAGVCCSIFTGYWWQRSSRLYQLCRKGQLCRIWKKKETSNAL